MTSDKKPEKNPYSETIKTFPKETLEGILEADQNGHSVPAELIIAVKKRIKKLNSILEVNE